MNLPKKTVLFFVLLPMQFLFAQVVSTNISLPELGICAHRGAMNTHPENTIVAFKEAIRLGAHMIEFDVGMTKDGQLVIIHDESVDRTSDGTGLVSEFTLRELKKLDVGSWKSKEFRNERIPTFKEVLQAMPQNIWLNIHLKGTYELGRKIAKVLVSENRLHQGVIACGTDAAAGVHSVDTNIIICNMERQADRNKYVSETAAEGFGFVQLLKKRDDTHLIEDIQSLKKNNVRVNYFYGDTESEVRDLFKSGVDFVLTNELDQMLEVAESIGIKRQSQFNFPKPKNGNTYVVAHRGVHHNIPENTLAAYQKAIDLGCDFVEIDLRKSKDGKFVSVHNETIDAYVNGITGKVNDFTLAELKQLNIGKRVGPEWKNERIPSLEEILLLCKGKIGIYLDLKEADVQAQIDIIKSYGMERDIIWYIPASYLDVIKEVQKYCSECIVMPDPGSKENIEKIAKEIHPQLIATDMGELNAEYVKIAKQLNIQIITDEKKGTVEEWDYILELGVGGIQTDHVEKLIHYLKSKK